MTCVAGANVRGAPTDAGAPGRSDVLGGGAARPPPPLAGVVPVPAAAVDGVCATVVTGPDDPRTGGAGVTASPPPGPAEAPGAPGAPGPPGAPERPNGASTLAEGR